MRKKLLAITAIATAALAALAIERRSRPDLADEYDD